MKFTKKWKSKMSNKIIVKDVPINNNVDKTGWRENGS